MRGFADAFLEQLSASALPVFVLIFTGRLFRLISGRAWDGGPAFVFGKGFEQEAAQNAVVMAPDLKAIRCANDEQEIEVCEH